MQKIWPVYNKYGNFVAMYLPKAFIERLHGLLTDEWETLADAITSSEPSVAVRVNTAQGTKIPEGAQRVPWCSEGFYLEDRPAFTFDTDWHVERYYVQRDLCSESITIDGLRGYVLIAHQGAILGFANNLGNRANNLYPKSQRILSTHLSAEKPGIILTK